MRRALILAAVAVAGFGVSQIGSSAPPGFCERKPTHPRCRTTSTATVPTQTTAPTTAPTTTEPPMTQTTSTEQRANVWVSP